MASGLTKLLTATATALDRRFGWDRLPLPLGVFTLAGLRTRLREENLYDTGAGGAKAGRRRRPARLAGRSTAATTTSGSRRWG